MNRVSAKLLIPTRMAAQVAGAFNPMPVTIPEAITDMLCN